MARFNLRTEDCIHDPEAKREFNIALFNVVADKYKFVTKALSLGRDGSWKRKLISSLPANLNCPTCVDLACGPGDITFQLAERYSHGKIVGIDICPNMLTLANKSNSFEHVSFQLGDMCETGLESASVDIVTGGYALRNAPSLSAALREIHRILRPLGTATFLDFSKPENRLLQAIQYRLLVTWGGLWGLVLHGNPEVYAYIAKSLRAYPNRSQLREIVADHGLVVTGSKRFYLGTLEILSLQKRELR